MDLLLLFIFQKVLFEKFSMFIYIKVHSWVLCISTCKWCFWFGLCINIMACNGCRKERGLTCGRKGVILRHYKCHRIPAHTKIDPFLLFSPRAIHKLQNVISDNFWHPPSPIYLYNPCIPYPIGHGVMLREDLSLPSLHYAIYE